MSKPIRLYALLFLTLSTVVFAAQEEQSQVLSLKQAIQIALKQNASLKQAYLQQAGAVVDVDAEKERRTPFFQWHSQASHYQQSKSEGGGQQQNANTALHMHYDLPLGGSVGSRVTSDSDWSVEVQQPLRRGFGEKVAKSSQIFAEQNQSLVHHQIVQQKIDLIQQVTTQYRQVQQWEKQVELQKGMLVLAKKNLEAVDLRIQAGRIAANDRFQVAFDVLQQENLLKQYEELYQQSRFSLWLLIGLPLKTEANLEVFEPSQEEPLEWLVYEQALVLHPQWEQMEVQKSMIEQQQWLAKDSLKSSLNLVGRSYMKRDPNALMGGGGGSGKSDYFVGVEWSVPLNHSKTQRQALMHANIMEEQWEVQANYLQQSLLKSVHQAFEEVKLKAKQRRMSHDSLAWAEKSLLAAQQKFEAGRSSSFELVAMQQQLQAAQLQSLESDIAYENALTQLQAVSGLLGRDEPDEQ